LQERRVLSLQAKGVPPLHHLKGYGKERHIVKIPNPGTRWKMGYTNLLQAHGEYFFGCEGCGLGHLLAIREGKLDHSM
jgi:hypothetical protein